MGRGRNGNNFNSTEGLAQRNAKNAKEESLIVSFSQDSAFASFAFLGAKSNLHLERLRVAVFQDLDLFALLKALSHGLRGGGSHRGVVGRIACDF